MASKDFELIKKIINALNENNCPLQVDVVFEYPLDKNVRTKLEGINNAISEDDTGYKLFREELGITELWATLIEKSIKCLRFNDTREPFSNSDGKKKPLAYGVDELSDYFKKYTSFEKLLYGGAPYYRDHVVHVFRVWLLGINALLEKKCVYLKEIKINSNCNISDYEKISIWTIISLTHDLGYPLEKAQKVLNQTKDMISPFIINPNISMDLNFNGIQTQMNDFVIRFMSSKMYLIDNYNDSGKIHEQDKDKAKKHDEDKSKDQDKDKDNIEEEKKYVARLQPKYYFKFQKSLEHNEHGILSCLIIYKLLLYFLESDFSINEDYKFDDEEVRQFYIRREIMRAIGSHTCEDIYHMDIFSFSFLLVVCDDAQDWGRKGIENLYIDSKISYKFGALIYDFKKNKENNLCKVTDEFEVASNDFANIKEIIEKQKRLYNSKQKIFRDGQDTAKRNFSFEKTTTITMKDEGTKPHLSIIIKILKEEKSEFLVEFTSDDFTSDKEKYSNEFGKIFADNYSESSYEDKIIYTLKEQS